jgi:hypothetical protein
MPIFFRVEFFRISFLSPGEPKGKPDFAPPEREKSFR